MREQLAPGFRLMMVMTVLTGFIYPGIVTALCQKFFPHQANGSLIQLNGKVAGSILIGQNFKSPAYFHPRPSAAGQEGYDPTSSGGANVGPTSQKLLDQTQKAVTDFKRENPEFAGPIPADLLTTSFSGLDPHISPASAKAQTPRVALARGISPQKVEQLIQNITEGRELGFLGEPRVNVLALNLELDRSFPNK
jgi:potassium-transporting ATPase KdpC subunit